jgi:hypothetical protein
MSEPALKPQKSGYMEHNPQSKKPSRLRLGFFVILGWLMGLEPTTTGITILTP